MIHNLSGFITDSSVPLMHHDPDRSWITDPDPDHPKRTCPKLRSAVMTMMRPWKIVYTGHWYCLKGSPIQV